MIWLSGVTILYLLCIIMLHCVCSTFVFHQNLWYAVLQTYSNNVKWQQKITSFELGTDQY